MYPCPARDDQYSSFIPFPHRLHRQLSEDHGSLDVDLHHIPPFVNRRVNERPEDKRRGIGDDDVHLSQLTLRPRKRVLDGCFVGCIGREYEGSSVVRRRDDVGDLVKLRFRA